MSDRSLTTIEFSERIDAAKPGEWIIYHVGLLAADRANPTLSLGFKLDRVADFAYAAARDDRVHLVQRKVTSHMYEYIAIKKGPKRDTRRTRQEQSEQGPS